MSAAERREHEDATCKMVGSPFLVAISTAEVAGVGRAHSRFPGHALTPTGVMAIRCKQFHLPDL